MLRNIWKSNVDKGEGAHRQMCGWDGVETRALIDDKVNKSD
jgi:hypothetical protein